MTKDLYVVLLIVVPVLSICAVGMLCDWLKRNRPNIYRRIR